MDEVMEQKCEDQNVGKHHDGGGQNDPQADGKAYGVTGNANESVSETNRSMMVEEYYVLMKDGTTKEQIAELIEELKTMAERNAMNLEFGLRWAYSPSLPSFRVTIKRPLNANNSLLDKIRSSAFVWDVGDAYGVTEDDMPRLYSPIMAKEYLVLMNPGTQKEHIDALAEELKNVTERNATELQFDFSQRDDREQPSLTVTLRGPLTAHNSLQSTICKSTFVLEGGCIEQAMRVTTDDDNIGAEHSFQRPALLEAHKITENTARLTCDTDPSMTVKEYFIFMENGTSKQQIAELAEELQKMAESDAVDLEFDLRKAEHAIPKILVTIKGPLSMHNSLLDKVRSSSLVTTLGQNGNVHATMQAEANDDKTEGESSSHRPIYREEEKHEKSDFGAHLLCFVVGDGIDASHLEFAPGQIKRLDLETATLRNSVLPTNGEMNCAVPPFQHETAVASLIGGKVLGTAPGLFLIDVKLGVLESKQDNTENFVGRNNASNTSNKKNVDSGKADSSFAEPSSFPESGTSNRTMNTRTDAAKAAQTRYSVADVCHALKCIAKYCENNPGKRGVVNLSMSVSFHCPALIDSVKSLRKHNLLVIGSAGNDGKPVQNYWPASAVTALIVGSTTPNRQESIFSNYGHRIDLYAYGENTKVADACTGGYKSLSGTSLAAPQVSGWAACYLASNPEANPDDVRYALSEAALNAAYVTNDSQKAKHTTTLEPSQSMRFLHLLAPFATALH